MKSTKASNTLIENGIAKSVKETHKVWHKFSGWLSKTFGSDLVQDNVMEFKLKNGKPKKIKYKEFNEAELSRRLVGYEVLEKMEKYVARHCKEIRVVRCDDSLYAGSSIFLIPHPKHGITMLFVPQCTTIQNQFFLYDNHYKDLMKALKDMKGVYGK